jgi:methylenetetrahydrofolate dehydrogenase (NADP+)/methenyltetrahydrofolate cyclohydrolase
VNQGKIVIGDSTWLKPCTPAGMMELCKFYNIDLIWKNIVIIGRSNIVGKPIANLLINAQATVTICNSKTQNIDFFTKNADIIITALWVPHFLTADKIWKNTIVIDVGFSVIDGKIYGDADFENIQKLWNSITPVPGWVGSMTVAMLLNNTFLAFQNQKK